MPLREKGVPLLMELIPKTRSVMKKQLLLTAFILTATLFVRLPHAAAQGTDSAYKQALQEMLTASGAVESVKAMIPQLIAMTKPTQPGIPDSYWTALEKELQTEFIDRMVELYVPIYQKYLTLDDLREINRFYQTPVGSKLAQATPAMTVEGAQMGQKLGMEMAQEIVRKAQAYKEL